MGQKERRAWYIQHNICPVCGQRKALPNRQTCSICTEKNTLNNIKYRSLERERTYYARRKEKREQRISSGLCPNCGKKAVKGQLCLDCYVKRQKKHEQEKLERELRGDPRRERVKTGKCWLCSANAIPGKKVCENHYNALMQRPGFVCAKGENHPWTKKESLRIQDIRKKYQKL
nr:MAG TPA: dehydrogenase accessory protein [Caudoviricetes sp.]